MRWIFLLVLMANGFYLLWMETSGAGQSVKQVVAPLPNAPGLVLLAEVAAEGREGGAAETGPDMPAEPGSDGPERVPLSAPKPELENPEPGEPAVVMAEACWQLGPFERDEDAWAVAAAASEQGWTVSEGLVELSGPSSYWVYTGPYESRKKALQQLRAYKDAGVDSFLITEGDLANAISLGLFSSQKYADKAQARRRKQGYPAKIHVLERSSERIRLNLSDPAGELAIEGFLEAQKGRLELDGILKKSCI